MAFIAQLANHLESLPGASDVHVLQQPPARAINISAWEMENLCVLPPQLKSFYSTCDGFEFSWSIKLGESLIPVGKGHLNSVRELKRIRLCGASAPGELIDPTEERGSLSDIFSLTLNYPYYPHITGDTVVLELERLGNNEHVCLIYQPNSPRDCSVWLLDRAFEWWPLCGKWSSVEKRTGSAGSGGGGQVVPTEASSASPPHFQLAGHEGQQSDAVFDYVRLLLAHLGLPEWPQLAARAALLAAASHSPESLAAEIPCVSPTSMQWFSMFTPGRVQLADRPLDPVAASSSQQFTPASAFDADRVLRAGDSVSGALPPGNKVAGAALSPARAAAPSSAVADKGRQRGTSRTTASSSTRTTARPPPAGGAGAQQSASRP